MGQKTIHLDFSKSTKGTHVFVNETEKINLYLPKDMTTDEGEPLFQTVPKTITIDIDC
jgi:hypothetical protein